jgi:hypothetical protein
MNDGSEATFAYGAAAAGIYALDDYAAISVDSGLNVAFAKRPAAAVHHQSKPTPIAQHPRQCDVCGELQRRLVPPTHR